MSKKTSKKPKSKNIVEMQLVNPNAAGIDAGDSLHSKQTMIPLLNPCKEIGEKNICLH